MIGKGGEKGYSGWLVPRNLFRAGVFAVGSVLGWGAGDAPAQVFYACPAGAEPLFQLLPTRTSCPFVASPQVTDEPPALSPGRAFLYSVLLPGLGQRKLGKGRWLAYVAVEGAAWIAWGNARWSATNTRGEYQDLAWDVPRSFNGPRIDGDFSYYETLSNFSTSGVFDTDPGAPGIQPEMDLSTFNGQAWSLATEIHFPPGLNPLPGDPEYDDALDFYRDRAYDERFEWTWSGSTGEWDVYRGVIRSSDDDFRRASLMVGIVMANHLLSGVDGFVTARLRAAAGPGSSAGFRFLHDDRSGRLALVFQLRH